MSSLFEYVGNLHMHTPYSDGELYHEEIAQAALAAGLDFIVVTDHNVRVRGPEGYHVAANGRRVLVLIGEEVHDVTRPSQSNHMLVLGVQEGLAPLATDPQGLINAIADAGGMSFIAHPNDDAAPSFGQPAIPWESWDVHGFTGIEIWNYMSEFKSLLENRSAAIRYASNPAAGISGPPAATLRKWDELLSDGRRIAAIGGSDAHGTEYRLGRLRRTLFPYEFLFGAINMHVVLEQELSGAPEADTTHILGALRSGNAFVGYDQPHPTRGFRFSAQGERARCTMGDEIHAGSGVTLQTSAPARCDMRMIHDGEIIQQRDNGTNLTHITSKPGAYRVEAYIEFNGAKRGWIFSNPIYLR